MMPLDELISKFNSFHKSSLSIDAIRLNNYVYTNDMLLPSDQWVVI